MISPHNHSNIKYLYKGYSASMSLGKWVGVDKESNKKDIERRASSQKSDVSYTNSSCTFFLYFFQKCTFFCYSTFPYWFLMKLWYYYGKQQKEYIQERAYQCIWNNYIIFTQKYYNFTPLSMRVVKKYMCIKIPLCLMWWCDFLPLLI